MPLLQQMEGNIRKFYLMGIFGNVLLILPIIVLYLQYFGVNYTGLGLMEAIGCAVIVLVELPTGAFADMFGRRNSIVIGWFISGAAMLLVGFGSVLWVFILAYMLWGIGDAFFSGAWQAMLYDSLKTIRKKKLYLKILGRFILYTTVSLIIGLAIGPILFNMNVRYPWFVVAIFFFLAGLITMTMKEPPLKKKKLNMKTHFNQMKEGFSYATNHKIIKWIIGLSLVLYVPMFIVNTFIIQPFLVISGFDVINFSIVFPIIYGLASLVSVFAYKIEDKLGEKASLSLVMFVQALSFLLMWAIQTPLILIVFVMVYMNRDFGRLVMDKYVQEHTKSEVRATVTSVISLLLAAACSISAIIVGVVLDAVSIPIVMLSMGIIVIVAGGYLLGKKVTL